MSNVIYRSGNLLVRDTLFRTPRRSYRIRDIEKITIKRPLFWFGVPLAVGSYLLLQEFRDYLYSYEQYACVFIFTALPIILWFIGTLSITSKALTNDSAVTGFIPNLKKARAALEQVIFSTNDNQENLLENNHD